MTEETSMMIRTLAGALAARGLAGCATTGTGTAGDAKEMKLVLNGWIALCGYQQQRYAYIAP
jgi:hypothetical protein